jgi:DNA polymerase I
MTQCQLDLFGNPKKQEKMEQKASKSLKSMPESLSKAVPEKEIPIEKKSEVYPDYPEDLPPSYLVSVGYDGKKQLATLKLYEPFSKKIYFWNDNTGHKPYCLTSLPPVELKKLSRVTAHTSFDHFEVEKKFNPLLDKEVTVTKVVTKDPLAIGGRQSGCMRDIIPEDYQRLTGIDQPPKVWESYIRYYQSYIYDNNLALGTQYNKF